MPLTTVHREESETGYYKLTKGGGAIDFDILRPLKLYNITHYTTDKLQYVTATCKLYYQY